MTTRKSFTHTGGTTETDGRTLTFLANSGKVMCGGLTVDLDTLKAPLADGTLKLVSDLDESDRLSLPLLIDHMPSVEAQAGVITRLWMTDAGLMAQNAYLYSASEGLACVVRGMIEHDPLAKLLNLPKHKRVLLGQTIGHQAK